MADPTPPPYTPLFQLEPVGLDEDGRYGCTERSEYRAFSFPPGRVPYVNADASEPRLISVQSGREPVPAPWIEYINPEGLPYFHDPARRVITEANLHILAIVTAVNSAVEYVLSKFAEMVQGDWSRMDTELYLQVDAVTQICRYYFVDHQKRTLFWLTEVTSDAIGISRTVSFDVATMLLSDKYWMHVEWFGMHISFPDSLHFETSSILKFYLADVYTSSESTSPYGAGDAEKFIRLLDSFSGDDSSKGYRNWVTARVRGTIEGNRAINLYGERNARVSSLQSRILDRPEIRRIPAFREIDSFLFGRPSTYYRELCNLWVDKVAYNRQWRPFAQRVAEKAIQTVSWAGIINIASSVLLFTLVRLSATPVVNIAVGLEICSLTMGVLSMCLGMWINGIFSRLSMAVAERAGDYLEENQHDSYGFYPLAVKVSLPFGIFCWALAFFAVGLSLTLIEILRTSLDAPGLAYALTLPCIMIAIPFIALVAIYTKKIAKMICRRCFTSIALPLHSSDRVNGGYSKQGSNVCIGITLFCTIVTATVLIALGTWVVLAA